MAAIIADRVRDTSTTTGTGAVTVSGTAPTGYRTFSAVCTSPSDTIRVMIHNQAVLSEWEVSNATYSAANTLTRTTIESSSNANAAVSFSAGTKDVVHVQSAAQMTGGGGGTPGGSNLQVQYNNSSAFGGSQLYVDGANTISQRNSTNAQDLRVYNTWTGSADEWLAVEWSSNACAVRTRKSGSGSDRTLAISAGTAQVLTLTGEAYISLAGGGTAFLVASDGILPNTDNSDNLGRAANRWQIAFLGTTTVAALPTPAANLRGARTMVTDGTAVTTFNSIIAAGGSTIVPVWCDGTNWRIG